MTHYPRRAGSSRRRGQTRRGQTLLEFALVLVMLLMLTLGLVQFAILANQSMALAQVTREGARYAALNNTNPNRDTVVRQYIQNAANNYNNLVIPDDKIAIAWGAKTGDKVTVTIAYNMSNVMFLPNQFQLPGMENPIVFFSGEKVDSASYMMEGA